MTSCLVMRGKTNTGKTYAARKLAERLDAKCLHYDSVITFVCDCTRLFFENKNNTIIPQSFKNFIKEYPVNFRNDIKILISSHSDLFFALYDQFVKNFVSATELSENKLSINENRSRMIDLGNVGTYLEGLSLDIFKLVLQHIVKKTDFFVVEGAYFLENSYLEPIKTLCGKLDLIDCSCIPALGIESYKFQNENFTNLKDLEKRIITEFGKLKEDN